MKIKFMSTFSISSAFNSDNCDPKMLDYKHAFMHSLNHDFSLVLH